MRRLAFISLFFIGFILPLYLYLGWSLGSTVGWVLLSGLFLLVFSFPFLRHGPSLIQITYVGMGFLSYLMVFAILKDLLRAFDVVLSVGWTYAAAVLAVLIGTLIAHRGPKIVHLKLPVPHLAPELEGIKIAQISDLHIGPTIGRKYVEKVVAKVNGLTPDIIALTGDIGDGPVKHYREAITPLGELKSRYGAFYVPGNHEYYWNANEWMNVMNNLKAVVLMNRGKIVKVAGKKILMGGVSDPAGYPAPDPRSVYEVAPEADFKILLSHRPGFAPLASELGYNLQLSGHTHGGQFFPWTLIVRFVHKHFLGHYLVNGMWLNVNSGTGSWGPFLRLGTTSEITLIELFHSNKSLE